jgi:hypothetical protein
VPEQLFTFVQMEFPWELGPADGRYLLRGRSGGEPEHVVVLATLGGVRAQRSRLRLGSRRGAVTVDPQPPPTPVSVARATIIDTVPLAAESQAASWLAGLDADLDTARATAILNRVLFAQRIAAADPYTHECSADQALVIRAGWGAGEQVADGRWLQARELPRPEPRSARRTAALRPQERLAELVSARGAAFLCEELTLRARLDLDQGRLEHAALGLERAYATALPELAGLRRADLAARLEELGELQADAQRQALAALPDSDEQPDRTVLTHALERLEAALRARTAGGFER